MTHRSRFPVVGSGFVFPTQPRLRRDVAKALRAVPGSLQRSGVGTIVLLGLLATGCAAKGTTGAVPRPFPGANVPPRAIPEGDRATVEPLGIHPAVISLALSLRGTPYRNGGSDPAGFDCSGFVQWVYAQQGTALPREVRQQFRAGREIDTDEVKPGDLVFFETVSPGASHVGIALGDGDFVHAPSSRGVVRIERYTSGYWAERWVGARRIATAGEPAS